MSKAKYIVKVKHKTGDFNPEDFNPDDFDCYSSARKYRLRGRVVQ